MLISTTNIGLSSKPFVISEMSGNHNHSLDRAIKIVEAAAAAGVDALKLQTYTADTLTLDVNEDEFFVKDKDSLWKDKSLYELYEEAYTPWEWHEPIMKRANELGMLCFSSPFDESAVDFLETLDVPAYKIASPEIIHLPLVEKVAATGKPMIISTGMASVAEIDEAVQAARKNGCQHLALLKCTSSYPASPKNSNVLTIPHMRELFGCEVGLSDHTIGVGAALAAVSHGATVIEKHFTLARTDGGVDSAFSLEPVEMEQLVTETERAWQSLGKATYGPSGSEKASLAYRRSLYFSEDVKEGEMITETNVRIIRPGFGLAPKYYEVVLGRKVNRNVKKGAALEWELFS
jgi:pseudaminic acid synthase